MEKNEGPSGEGQSPRMEKDEGPDAETLSSHTDPSKNFYLTKSALHIRII